MTPVCRETNAISLLNTRVIVTRWVLSAAMDALMKCAAPYTQQWAEAVVTALVMCAHVVVVVLCGMELSGLSALPFRVGWPILCAVLPLGYLITSTLYLVIIKGDGEGSGEKGGAASTTKTDSSRGYTRFSVVTQKAEGTLRSGVLFVVMTALVEFAASQSMVGSDALIPPTVLVLDVPVVSTDAELMQTYMSVVVCFKVVVALTLVLSVEVVATHLRRVVSVVFNGVAE